MTTVGRNFMETLTPKRESSAPPALTEAMHRRRPRGSSGDRESSVKNILHFQSPTCYTTHLLLLFDTLKLGWRHAGCPSSRQCSVTPALLTSLRSISVLIGQVATGVALFIRYKGVKLQAILLLADVNSCRIQRSAKLFFRYHL